LFQKHALNWRDAPGEKSSCEGLPPGLFWSGVTLRYGSLTYLTLKSTVILFMDYLKKILTED
jgi:hypothetical protein